MASPSSFTDGIPAKIIDSFFLSPSLMKLQDAKNLKLSACFKTFLITIVYCGFKQPCKIFITTYFNHI